MKTDNIDNKKANVNKKIDRNVEKILNRQISDRSIQNEDYEQYMDNSRNMKNSKNDRHKRYHRKKLKHLKLIGIFLATLFCMLIIFLWKDISKYEKNKKSNDENYLSIGECLYSVNTLFGEDIINISNSMEDNDSTPNEKDKFNNMLKSDMPMQGDHINFVISRIGLDENIKEEIFADYSEIKYITRSQWKEILYKIIDAKNMSQTVSETKISVYDIIVEDHSERAMIITDGGICQYISNSNYIKRDSRLDMIIRDENIIFIYGSTYADTKYENILIKSTDGENITAALNGSERVFQIKGLSEPLENVTADIEIMEGKVTALTLKRESISGKVLAVAEDSVEVEGFGKLSFSEKCRYYIGYRNYALTDRNCVLVGSEQLRFVVADQLICAVIVRSDVNAKNIRVLLKSTGYKSLFHESASVTCQSRYQLSSYTKDEAGNLVESVTEHEASEGLEIFPQDERLTNGRIKIIPIDENAKMIVNSISRNGSAPEYRGTIEISVYDGQIVIINDVALEEYLYSVVPSEMPSSYGVEALKVQAVCARSYAVSHLNDGKLSRYGAQIDDSTDYQVYNNTRETENAIAAVNATYDEILECDGEVANTYFFATSCGSTTDATIWGANELSYVKGKLLCGNEQNIDLTDNEKFREFIMSDFESYDSGTSWYRWNIRMTEAQISKIIDDNLGNMCDKYPDKILIRQADGTYESGRISTVGKVGKIYAEKRLNGGAIDELVIEGDKAAIKILKQSTIRNLINPYGIAIHKNDGSSVDNFSALPSAFFTVENMDGGIMFYGGGFGHGAGMSQTAVKQMIEAGMSYQDILKFFYTGVEIGYYE